MSEADRNEPCPECRGTGWVIREREGIEEAVRCPGCTTDNRRRKLLEQANIPVRYRRKGFDDYKAGHPLQEQALAAVRRFADQFPLVERGMLLVGPCGVGKTHLSVATLQKLVREKLIGGQFIDEAELLRRLQYSYGPDSPETQREVMVPLMEVELLVWDDLGTGRPTEWVAETIRTILNHRYTHNKPTILTTNWLLERSSLKPVGSGSLADRNLDEKTLQERIGKRLYSRILEMCQVIRIDGQDYRERAGRQKRHKIALPRKGARQFNVLSLMECPACGWKKIEEVTRGELESGKIDLWCRCQSCSHQFGAQFSPSSAELEYSE